MSDELPCLELLEAPPRAAEPTSRLLSGFGSRSFASDASATLAACSRRRISRAERERWRQMYQSRQLKI